MSCPNGGHTHNQSKYSGCDSCSTKHGDGHFIPCRVVATDCPCWQGRTEFDQRLALHAIEQHRVRTEERAQRRKAAEQGRKGRTT